MSSTGRWTTKERANGAEPIPCETASIPVVPKAPPAGFASGTHRDLFTPEAARSCDACGRPVHDDEEPGHYELPGQGVYVWSRGDSTRFEAAPLCASCAAAIGVTALARWEIEEEEG